MYKKSYRVRVSDPLVWFLHQRGCAIMEILSHASVLDYDTLCSRKK